VTDAIGSWVSRKPSWKRQEPSKGMKLRICPFLDGIVVKSDADSRLIRHFQKAVVIKGNRLGQRGI
jgi:hypothetical protein